MAVSKKTALLVAPLGQLCDGLQVLLTAIPQLEMVIVAVDRAAVLPLMVIQQPGVVLIDVDNQPDEAIEFLSQIKTNWPQISCLILTDKTFSSEALVSRADGVLRKGMSAANLFEAIAQFIISSCGN